MKLHAKCDRCGKFAEAGEQFDPMLCPGLPDGWRRFTSHDNMVNVSQTSLAVVCTDCAPIIEKAIAAAVARHT